MGYQVTARKWRPQTFDEVVEQHHVTRTLRNAIRLGRVAHAYLFAGTRGVGKTTMARVLAKALNCEQGPTEHPCNTCASCVEITQGTSVDILEIDGASNRGIDEIRDLRERLRYLPSRGRYTVYILDEVHMLTKEAFNALLKTLEEPPAHVVFIFATTELERIPPTIVSRCQRFEFKRVSLTGLAQQLGHITTYEGIHISPACLLRIAKAAEGSMRDAQSLLDQVVAYCGTEVHDADVNQVLGDVGIDLLAQCLQALVQQEAATALQIMTAMQEEGHEASGIVRALLEGLRHLIVLKTVPEPAALIPLSAADLETLRLVADAASVEEIYGQFHTLSAAEQTLRYASNPFLVLEMTLVRMACVGRVQPLQTILEHLQQLEAGVPASATPALPRTPPAPAVVLPARPAVARNGQAPAITPAPAVHVPESTVPASPAPRWEAPPPAPPVSIIADPPLAEPEPAAALTTAAGLWEMLRQRVAAQRAALGAYMQHGQPLRLDGQRLVVGFDDAFSLDSLNDPENMVTVRDMAHAMLGRPLAIVFEALASPEPANHGAGMASPSPRSELGGALSEHQRQKNELKQALIDIFGAIPL